jgi:SPP1 family predicted phage head-tail adaptor
LDHRVTVLRAVATVSDYNEPVETFSSYITVWMRRIDVSMGETVRAAEVGADITAHFVVRYSPEVATVTPKDRLQLEDGLLYDITGVRELARNQWLEIHAVARADR